MTKQNEFTNEERFAERAEAEPAAGAAEPARKVFVEPEVSAAGDVLEATTFFMSTTSGVTN